MFSYEQAAAVTDEQLSALSDVQRTALAMVLTPWEDRPVDFRGELMAFSLYALTSPNGLIATWCLRGCFGCSLYRLRTF